MLLTGVPFSLRKRTQKSLIPGPLMMAPRMMFLPFFKVSRRERQSSLTIRRSPERITASSPFSHHMDAELEPTDIRMFSMSSGHSMTVTAQNSTPYTCFFRPEAKRKSFTLNSLLSSACQVSFCLPTFTLSPSLGRTVN